MGMQRYENMVTYCRTRPRCWPACAPERKLIVFEKDEAHVDLWHADLPEECVMVFGSETDGVSPSSSRRPTRSSAFPCTASTTRSR